MQTAAILYMNPTERNQDDRPFDPLRDMKKQLDQLIGHIGGMRDEVAEIRTALKGNDYGTEGLVVRIEQIESWQSRVESEQRKMEAKLEEYEKAAKLNRRYLFAFFTALGTVGGTVLKIIIDHLVPVKK
jgi:chromosome segregation ATPase